MMQNFDHIKHLEKFEEINQVLRKFQKEFDLESYQFTKHPDNNLWTKLEDYVKKNPKVRISYCDSSGFETCLLVHVPTYSHHKNADATHYVGDKMFYITQGNFISEFYLCPDHQKELINNFKKINNDFNQET